METKVILFDLGGVLLELGGIDHFGQLIDVYDPAEIWQRWLTSTWVRRYERGQCTRNEFARGMVQENGLDIAPEAFLEVFIRWPRGLFPGAVELVAAVDPKLTACCLSNTNEFHWGEQKDAESVQELFARPFLSHEIGLVKPDRAIFDFVSEALGWPGAALFLIDDNAINVEGARAAGWQAERAAGVLEARRVLEDRNLLA